MQPRFHKLLQQFAKVRHVFCLLHYSIHLVNFFFTFEITHRKCTFIRRTSSSFLVTVALARNPPRFAPGTYLRTPARKQLSRTFLLQILAFSYRTCRKGRTQPTSHSVSLSRLRYESNLATHKINNS